MRVIEIVYSDGSTSMRTETRDVSVTLTIKKPGTTVAQENDLGEMTEQELAAYIASKTS